MGSVNGYGEPTGCGFYGKETGFVEAPGSIVLRAV